MRAMGPIIPASNADSRKKYMNRALLPYFEDQQRDSGDSEHADAVHDGSSQRARVDAASYGCAPEGYMIAIM
jgi:hypothetical protein